MKRLLSLLIVGLLLTACSAEPQPAPTETSTLEAATTAPTPTSLPPTRTPTPLPSPTVAPTAAPTATPVPNDVWVAAANGLNLRAEGKATAQLVQTLKDKQHLVAIGQPVGPDAGGITWQNVQTDDGKTGWVSSQFLTRTNPAGGTAAATPVPTTAPAPATPASTPAPAKTSDAYVTSTDGLNLRAQANTTSNVVVIIPFGAHVTTLSAAAAPDAAGIAWQNVRTDDGKTGFVAAQYLSATKPGATTPTPSATITSTATITTPIATATITAPIATTTPSTTTLGNVYVTAADGLNLRAQPATTAAIVATLAFGQRLTALAPKGTPDAAGIAWQNVRTEAGQAGFAAAEFLSSTPVTTTAGITPTATVTSTPVSGANAGSIVDQVLRRINELRAQNGAQLVTPNAQLAAAALRFSQDMAKTGLTTSHTGSDGSTPQTRTTAAGYAGKRVAEVIYGGQVTIDDVWHFWTTDKVHANVILDARFKDVGIAVYNVGNRFYYTADFGEP